MKKLFLLTTILLGSISAVSFAQEVNTGDTTGTGSTTITWETTTGTVTDTGTVTTGTVITTTGAGLSGTDVINGFSKIRGTWKLINENFGYAKKFFAKWLSGDALSWSKALVTEKNNAIKALNQELKTAISSSGVIDWDVFAQKYVDIYTTFKTNATPYVNPTKLEAFNKYIDAKIATVKKNLEYRKTMITKKEIAYKKMVEKKAALEKAKAEKKAALEKAKAEKKVKGKK